MLRNILITGSKVAIIDAGTKRHLSSLYNVIISENTKEDIRRCMKLNRIHLAIICIGSDLKENLITYKYLVDYQEMKLPLFILGAKEDCDRIKNISNIKGIEGVFPRPLNINKLTSAIDALTLNNNSKKDYGKPVNKISSKMKNEKKYDDSSVEYVDDIEKEVKEANLNEKEDEKNKKKILVVDDDVKILKLISIYLEEEYDVAIAKSGESALKYLKKNNPDMILLDYMMPDEDGGDVLLKMRNYEKCKSIPVLFLTGIADAETVKRLISLQPQGYILKPVTKVALHEKINSVWEREQKIEPEKVKKMSDSIPEFIKERIVPKTVDVTVDVTVEDGDKQQ